MGEYTPGPIAYRGYEIDYAPPPIPTRNCDWCFAHVNYDGPDDERCGYAPSLEAAKAEIDERLEDNFDCHLCSEAWPSSCLAVECPHRIGSPQEGGTK